MKKHTNNKLIPIIFMGVLSICNITFVESNIWNIAQGNVLDISSWNPEGYQVESVRQLKDGNYIVSSKAKGFKSDIEVEVTFDTTGTMIEQVQILFQDETENIGTKVTDESFLTQFIGKETPIGIKGSDMVAVSPETGEVWGAGEVQQISEAKEETKKIQNLSNPERWNASDQSPEAVAVRNLYGAGLLSSAIEKQPLTTSVADYSPEKKAMYELHRADLTTDTGKKGSYVPAYSPEGQAKKALYQAGLLSSAQEGKPMEQAVADYSPEEKAEYRLRESGLIETLGVDGEAAEVVGQNLYEIDGVTGATISSKAVAEAVDQAYFFMNEKVLK